MSDPELVELAKHCKDSSPDPNHYAGVKLTTLRCAEGSVSARSSEFALSATTSKKAIVIAVHKSTGNMPMGVNQQLAIATDKVAEHLRQSDY